MDLIGTIFDAAILAYPCVLTGVAILKRGVCLRTPTLMKVNKALVQIQNLETAMLRTPFTLTMSRRQKELANRLSLKDVSIIMTCFTKCLVPASLLDLQI